MKGISLTGIYRYVFVFFILSCDLNAQTKILHYTETSGFDHLTRQASFTMFTNLANQHNLIIENDSTGITFNSLNDLMQYKIIVFSNTTGDLILDSLQRSNFEQYISAGFHFIGIHSATDTYRHSSANGMNTGTWDFYAEMIGASVQENPNHVSGQPVYSMEALQSHQLLTDISSPWIKAEEYYYWENGYYDSTNQVLLKVENTIGPNGLVNSYDSARATTWYREHISGSKIFYTSLGHDPLNFSSDTLFYKLIRNAIQWIINSTGIENSISSSPINVFPNPVSQFININAPGYRSADLYNLEGKRIFSEINLLKNNSIDFSSLIEGAYFLKLFSNENQIVKYVIKLK